MEQSDQKAIEDLQLKIKQKQQLFDFGMRNGKEFGEMKILYIEIKALEAQLAKIQNAKKHPMQATSLVHDGNS